MTKKITKGQKFGRWQLKRPLGAGGNGFVWLAINSRAEEVAIKILAKLDSKNKAKVYARFRDEVKVVQANSDIAGLLPIIESYLPGKIADEFPWYTMPVAQSLDKHLDNARFEAAIQVILEAGKTLAKLHERGICHRDIKPANILIWGDKVCISDFGLVYYPKKPDLTGTREQIGAKWTIAPEMKRNSNKADGKPADVYSLAKTLWILLTGRKDGFEGQYNPDSVNGLGRLKLTEPEGPVFWFGHAPLVYTRPLDDLLRAGTDDDPLQRPTMSQFVERLDSWVNTYKDFAKRNLLQWQDTQTRLFPTVVPQRAIWENTDSIVEILNYLGSVNSLNYMLLPDSGGEEMQGAKRGLESGTIELAISDRIVYVVKPKRLIFESFDFDWEWNYFRLATGDLEATGIGAVYRGCESLLEIAPLQYISESDWCNDIDGERIYPSDSRHVYRYINGDFVILQKSSTYNRSSYTYDGRHNQMGADEFRNYISQIVQLVQQIMQDEKLAEIASEKGLTMDDVISGYLDEVFRQKSSKRLQKILR